MSSGKLVISGTGNRLIGLSLELSLVILWFIMVGRRSWLTKVLLINALTAIFPLKAADNPAAILEVSLMPMRPEAPVSPCRSLILIEGGRTC